MIASVGGGTEVHELGITETIVRTISDRLGDQQVVRVTLVVGRLSGVVADSVRFCFDVCTQNTTLAGAALEVVDVMGRARCRVCGTEFDVPDLLVLCPCGSADAAVVAGEELLIRDVEVSV